MFQCSHLWPRKPPDMTPIDRWFPEASGHVFRMGDPKLADTELSLHRHALVHDVKGPVP